MALGCYGLGLLWHWVAEPWVAMALGCYGGCYGLGLLWPLVAMALGWPCDVNCIETICVVALTMKKLPFCVPMLCICLGKPSGRRKAL